MSVYAGDRVPWVRAAVESMERQTLPPDQFVVVRDGPVGEELEGLLKTLEDRGLLVLRLEENRGLANALAEGLQLCSEEFVARMDADDVSDPERMSLQVSFLAEHPEVGLVGSWYTQFDPSMATEVGVRAVPESHAEIIRMARTRTPFNHVTAVFRREAAVAVESYRGAALFFEDWWLGWRLMRAGYQLHNLQTSLVKVRGGHDFVGRRHGLKYGWHEWRNVWGLWGEGHISFTTALKTCLVRIPPRFLPRGALRWIYESLLRRQAPTGTHPSSRGELE